MPEGDTIHRAARALDKALAGRTLVRFEAERLVYRPFPPGTIVRGAEARGKHCLIHFDDGRTLHTHMRMTGSWHLYKPGERWRKSPRSARAVIETDEWVAVCFAAPVVELVDDAAAGSTDHLGPDLAAAGADLDEAARRLGPGVVLPPGTPVGVALLDQRIACGVGNIHRCEALYAEGVDPHATIDELDDETRRRLVTTASTNLQRGIRTSYVYGRRGRPCRRCGTPVAWEKQGPQHRGTYWCPTCQAPGLGGTGPRVASEE